MAPRTSSSSQTYPSLKDFRRLQDSLKLPLRPLSWFSSLFGEAQKIRRWNQRTGVLKPQWIPFTWKLALEPLRLFQLEFQDRLQSVLLPEVEEILNTGWKVLSKTQYNHIAVLKRLLTLIPQVDWIGLTKSSKLMPPAFRSLEAAFITLSTGPEGSSALPRIFETWGRLNPENRPRIDKCKDLSRYLMNSFLPGGLYSLLQGSNLLRVRRFLALEDFFEPAGDPLVSPFEYDAPREVQNQISAELVRLEKSLLLLWEEKTDLEDLCGLIPDENAEATLEGFIQEILGIPAPGLTGASPVLPFFQSFLRAYLSAFGLLLSGKYIFKPKSPPEDVLDAQVFEQEVAALLTLFDRMESIIFTSPPVSLARWTQLLQGDEAPREGEGRIKDSLKELSEKIVTLGKKMARQRHDEFFQQISDRTIKVPGPFFESTLDLVAKKVCTVSFCFGLLNHNQSLRGLVAETAKIQEEFKNSWGDFARMGTPERIEELASRWKIERG